jgi:trehalose 6-phosphate synthase
VPSRVDIRKYKELKRDIERLVSTLNGQFTRPGWVPVHYMYRSLDQTELLALYRTAHVALVTPLKDGMNLVAKEYCACNGRSDAVLILSEFAGAAEQLRDGAILVNPYDIEGVADALHQAVTMPRGERNDRMRRLRKNVRSFDVHWWASAFLADAAAPVA